MSRLTIDKILIIFIAFYNVKFKLFNVCIVLKIYFFSLLSLYHVLQESWDIDNLIKGYTYFLNIFSIFL